MQKARNSLSQQKKVVDRWVVEDMPSLHPQAFSAEDEVAVAGSQYQPVLVQLMHPVVREDLIARKIVNMVDLNLKCESGNMDDLFTYIDLLRQCVILQFQYSTHVMRAMARDATIYLRKLILKSSEQRMCL